jgi:hypothetical protein
VLEIPTLLTQKQREEVVDTERVVGNGIREKRKLKVKNGGRKEKTYRT